MKIESVKVTKLTFSDIPGLDPISVIAEDLGKGKGKITISNYDTSWTSYWGAMGDRIINEFFCDCNVDFLADTLSHIDSDVYDLDAITVMAKERDVEFYRVDPWNDYEFLEKMFGVEDIYLVDLLPTKPNPKYQYLCRIIKAVQQGLASHNLKPSCSYCHGDDSSCKYCNKLSYLLQEQAS